MARSVRVGSESPQNAPQLNILSHPLNSENKTSTSLSFRPEIEIILFKNKYTALLDSGASVSAMSDTLYNILKNDSSNFVIPSFPLSNTFLTTAITNKSVKINSQIYLNFYINDYKTHAIFLIVPHLSTPLILGTDWLVENGINLNYNTRKILFPSPFKSVPFKIVSTNHNNDLINSLRQVVVNNIHSGCISDTSAENLLPLPPSQNCTFNNIPLDDNQQQQINSLLKKFHHIFQDTPGVHKSFTYKFNVRDHVPYKIKPYPVPFCRRAAVQHEINKMITWGIIERSDSPYNNPLVTVIKSDGSIRLCLDARKLNTIILLTRESSPPMDEILAKFNNKNVFSSLDFTSSYWQIPLDPTVRQYNELPL